MAKPIKRHTSIQPISREHHQDLLLCWKIRTGLRKGIEPVRIKKYLDWFYETHVLPHFKLEEEYLFPILGSDHVLVQKALTQHRRLKRLFHSEKDLMRSINQIEEELEQHVRFEERVLFEAIQSSASPAQLLYLAEVLQDRPFVENTEDEFWK